MIEQIKKWMEEEYPIYVETEKGYSPEGYIQSYDDIGIVVKIGDEIKIFPYTSILSIKEGICWDN